MNRILNSSTSFLASRRSALVGMIGAIPLICSYRVRADVAQVSISKVMLISLETGVVAIELRQDKAPATIARLEELASQRFYDGLSFIRVEPGHVVQGGDPSFDATGGSGRTIKAEISDLRHLRGAVGMARDEDINSADSQFYICLADRPMLDGKYTIIGYVRQGMNLVDAFPPGDGPRGLILERERQPRILALRIFKAATAVLGDLLSAHCDRTR